MGICYIIGAGDCAALTFEPTAEDLVIAADGGLRYLEKAGIRPDLVIGDFDSLGYVPQAHEFVRLPVMKDQTDLQEAADLAVTRGYRRIRFFGALGGSRFSHSVANLQLLCGLAEQGCEAELIDARCCVHALRNGSLHLSAREAGYVSVFAANDVCTGVTIRGLKYPLENATLRNRFALGVSNEFIGEDAEICVADGTLLILIEEFAR